MILKERKPIKIFDILTKIGVRELAKEKTKVFLFTCVSIAMQIDGYYLDVII